MKKISQCCMDSETADDSTGKWVNWLMLCSCSTYKQEQFLLQTISSVQDYAEKIIEFRSHVWHRIHGIPEVFLDDIMLAKLEMGEFVHPVSGLRRRRTSLTRASDFTSFWGSRGS